MQPTLIFDIETVPDIVGLRRLHELPDSLPDGEVAEYAFQLQRARNGSDFLPHYLQRVVVISCVLRSAEQIRVFSLAEPKLNEAAILQRFFDGIARYSPQLVSWNGGGFDLPVLHYRGLVHGIHAARYWDLGDGDFADSRDFRWNNYISRYHTRHLDLMDLLALYQPRASAPLDALARLMGLPGKLGMDGGQVWNAWQQGRIDEIRDYCETDVVNTYLVFLRFQQMRGLLDAAALTQQHQALHALLSQSQGQQWPAFLAEWGWNPQTAPDLSQPSSTDPSPDPEAPT